MLSSKFLSSTVSSLVARRSPSSALAAPSRAMSLLTSTPPSGSATPKALADKLQLKNPSLLKFANYINGEWVSSSRSADATFDVQNPANDDVIAQCPDLNAEEVREAINAAEGARKSWAATTAKHRSDLLLKLVKIIDENTEDLAKIISIVRLPRPPFLSRSLPPSSDAALALLNIHRRTESPSLTLRERSLTETASLTGAFFSLAMPARAGKICPRRIGADRRTLVLSWPTLQVRRRGPSIVRRHHPFGHSWTQEHRHQAAGWSLRHPRLLELPQRHDRSFLSAPSLTSPKGFRADRLPAYRSTVAKAWSCARGRLHRRRQGSP